MSTPTVPVDPIDDAAKAAAQALAVHRKECHQVFLKEERDKFSLLARKDFDGNLPVLLDILSNGLSNAAHFAPILEIGEMVRVMRELPLDDFPAAYGFGGYQDGTFTLPTGETEETAKDKIIHHTVECGVASIILRGLAGERTVIPWEKAAGLPQFDPARLSEDSWDVAKLKDMATKIQDREERVLKSLFHQLGPWLIWFRPDPGAVVTNWQTARAFVRSFQSLPDSIRFGFPPYLFSIVKLDPSKLVTPPVPPPAAAASVPALEPEPTPTTPPPPAQYPDDDQAL